MKREILFRGKRIDNGEWVYGTGFTDFLNIYPEKRGCTWLWCDYKYNDGLGKGWIEISLETLCQFTGLIDKNGKKIFEGDILYEEYTQQRTSDGKIQTNKNAAVVTFGAYTSEDYDDRNSYSWLMDGIPISNNDIDGYESRNPYWTITSGDLAWRVIGNVFDNPELVASHD